jgi:TonB family protein
VILLPLSALAGLTPEQLEAVLAHELAHIRRHDYLVNLLQMAAETVLFYHPAVWWISARIRHERELCCDDAAVRATGGALCYARALTALEKMRAGRPALALAAADGPLFLRIRRLVSGSAEYGPSKLSGMIAISLGMACVALCVNWAQGQEPTRGFAFIHGSGQDAPGIAVDTAGAPLIHRSGVEYPRNAKDVEGTVAVEATLDAAGNVIDAHVLSGPDELRKAALTSVLNWHFAPGSRNTRVVQIAFHPSAAPPQAEPEQKEEGSVELRVPLTVRTRTPQSEEGNRRLAQLQEDADQKQNEQFLREQTEKSRQQLERLQSQPNADPASVEKSRTELADLERKTAAVTEPGRTEELRRRAQERERASRGWERTSSTVGSKLASIEIRGLSDQAGTDLLSRLPVHEGDTLTAQSMETAARTIRQYDEHLEFNFGHEPEGAVLRIHPAGAAGAPLLERK